MGTLLLGKGSFAVAIGEPSRTVVKKTEAPGFIPGLEFNQRLMYNENVSEESPHPSGPKDWKPSWFVGYGQDGKSARIRNIPAMEARKEGWGLDEEVYEYSPGEYKIPTEEDNRDWYVVLNKMYSDYGDSLDESTPSVLSKDNKEILGSSREWEIIEGSHEYNSLEPEELMVWFLNNPDVCPYCKDTLDWGGVMHQEIDDDPLKDWATCCCSETTEFDWARIYDADGMKIIGYDRE